LPLICPRVAKQANMDTLSGRMVTGTDVYRDGARQMATDLAQ